LHFERWCHVFGCGQWFNVARDTFTHEIHAVYRMGEPAPEIDR
jgi:sarcosine oxidase subunit delta